MVDVAKILAATAETIIPKDGLAKKLELAKKEKRPLLVKLGIDPTAPDIHLGFAVVLRQLRLFQDAGHTAVLILGDFTAKVGDPSGRSKTRPLLSDAQIAANARTFRAQALKILRKDRLQVRRNSEWLGRFRPDDFLKLFTHVTASKILAREDFQKRLSAGQPIGLHELLYPVLQGYDSVAIKADIELGGNDQTLNILMGRDVQEQYGQPPQTVILNPLLVGLDGQKKMSKSLGNYIGITDAPGDMYGKVMSISDNLMEQYVRLCTSLDWNNLKALKPMDAKKRLAHEIVRFYHGEKSAAEAVMQFSSAFQKGEFPADAPVLHLGKSMPLLQFVTTHKLFSSNSEARRKVAEGAVHIDGEKITDPSWQIRMSPNAVLHLKIGKRTFYRVAGK